MSTTPRATATPGTPLGGVRTTPRIAKMLESSGYVEQQQVAAAAEQQQPLTFAAATDESQPSCASLVQQSPLLQRAPRIGRVDMLVRLSSKRPRQSAEQWRRYDMVTPVRRSARLNTSPDQATLRFSDSGNDDSASYCSTADHQWMFVPNLHLSDVGDYLKPTISKILANRRH
jgi:hypothetical protein